MRGALVVGCAAVLGAAGLGCGPVQPRAMDASGLADPLYDAADADAVTTTVVPAAAPATATAAIVEAAKPVVPRVPVSSAACTKWPPKDLSASVMRIPKALAAGFMVPLFDAACVCSRAGDHLAIVARIVPEDGKLTAVTGTSWNDPTMKPDPGVDACLASVLEKVSFETFEVGSDVVCLGQPEAQPEPRSGPPVSFMKPPRMVGCGGSQQKSKIVYPVQVDRRNEKPAEG